MNELGVRYGVWNNIKKEWQFGICARSKKQATRQLFDKIGKDAYKWRFEIKKLPITLWKEDLK